ncbi:unnamed protein product [Aphanomyces euteiches]|nr:hypothetical protein Ae201684P_010213 [Aphanomyces euteiches]
MYWDLNVPVGAIAPDAQGSFLEEIARLGIGGIALNVECDAKTAPPPVEKLTPWTIKQSKKLKPQVQGLRIQDGKPDSTAHGSVRQLKRITIQCEDMNAMHSLNTHKIIQAYGVVAVEALSARVFQFLCENGEVDIITFDMSSRLPFQLRKPLIDAAIKRNIYFEIKYMHALGDSSSRRYFFSNASNLIRITKGRNLLFSSGAVREMLLRSPYDIMTVGLIMGLKYPQSREAVIAAPVAVIEHGVLRRTKGNMEVKTNGDENIDMES